MKELMEMRDKRVQSWNAAKAFLESHRGEDGTLSAEDDAIFNKMMDDVDKLGREIARMEKMEAMDVEMSKATSKPLTSAPTTRMEDEPVSKTGRGGNGYAKNFWNAMRSKSVSHEVLNALQVGTDSEGGYLVPDEYERTLIEALEDQNIFRQLAHVIHTSSGDRKIPVVASKGTASWIDEEAQYPESDDAFGQVSIGAYKLATMIKISEELLNDSVFDMPAYIAKEFARRIGAAEEEAFFTGNGTGKPLGILAATGGAETGVTAAAADKITMDEVIDLFYSLRAPYRRNAVFIMNDATVKALRKLKDGQGQYLWQPSITAGTPDTILNRPVYTSGFMPTLATGNKTILFGDLGYYWVADREGRSFKRLNELYPACGRQADPARSREGAEAGVIDREPYCHVRLPSSKEE